VETDDEFAARMRTRRGDPPPRRVPPWRQLLDITIENVHEVVMRPGVVDNEGNIAETIGVDVVSAGDAGNAYTGDFAVQTLLVTPDGDYEHAVIERRVRRMKLLDGGSGWLLHDGLANGEWCVVEFRASEYEAHVKRIADYDDAERAFESWLDVFEHNPLLVQHTHPSMIAFDRTTLGWVVDPVLSGIDEDAQRAQVVLKKREAWIDHDGKLLTPWGAINCAEQPPVIVPGSDLERAIGNGWGRASIKPAVWRSGLKMPSYDRARVRRILAAQSVIVEVPLVA
jgi:hypothetical protein